MPAAPFTVVDLFSGGGGMSYGFHAHPAFDVVGAADAQLGKPSAVGGSLGCNSTYQLNMGLAPVPIDLGAVEPARLRSVLGVQGTVDVLTACPPCTGFSRTAPQNHLRDDRRNGLVGRTAAFVAEFRPRVLLMENARELLTGRFRHHFDALRSALVDQGYQVAAGSHVLSRFGLPQNRERALVVATAPGVAMRDLDDLWHGLVVRPSAVTVRRAIAHLPPVDAGRPDPDDPEHLSPQFGGPTNKARIAATPTDGGSWRDLWVDPTTRHLLTPAQLRSAERGRFGSHPDVYGRLRWDTPAPTIKRECGHIGNGRYAHPEQHRLLSLREMALLNGFPKDYRFGGASLANRYRHVGDAVPPLISYQLAGLASWILTGIRPAAAELVLPGTSLTAADLMVG